MFIVLPRGICKSGPKLVLTGGMLMYSFISVVIGSGSHTNGVAVSIKTSWNVKFNGPVLSEELTIMVRLGNLK